MATLRELLGTGDKRPALIDDSLRVLEAEVDDKSGLSGIAIKTAFKVVKGISPGFLRQVVDHLLDDFLNALVWASFPKTKAALHARQHEERLAHGPGGNRSRASDRLTCFDEGGVFVESALPVGPTVYRLELEERGDRVGVFGHAIYEHALRSARVTQGAALVVAPSNDLDGALARVLAARDVPEFGRVRLAD